VKTIAISLGEKDVMRMEAILMDGDEKDALDFIKQVIMPRVREKGSSALDPRKGTGIKL
jgi:hypothetical protein